MLSNVQYWNLIYNNNNNKNNKKTKLFPSGMIWQSILLSTFSREYVLITGTILSFNNNSYLPEDKDLKQYSEWPSIFPSVIFCVFKEQYLLPPLKNIKKRYPDRRKPNREGSWKQLFR